MAMYMLQIKFPQNIQMFEQKIDTVHIPNNPDNSAGKNP